MRTALALAVLVAFTAPLHAENWANWRGPLHNGSSPEKGIPEKFSKTENVAWVCPLPGRAGATPIIWDDTVFVSSADGKTKDLLALCINRKDGSVRWQVDTIGHDRAYSVTGAPQIAGKVVVIGNGGAEFDSRGFRVTDGQGDNPLADLLKADSLYLGRKLAAEWHLTKGSPIQFQVGPRQVQARVAGVIQDQSDRVSSWDHVAIMDIAAAQVLFGLVGKLDRIDVVTNPEVEVDAAAQAVRAGHLAMVRGVDDDGVLREAERIDFRRAIADSSLIRAVGAGKKLDRTQPIAARRVASTTSSATPRVSRLRRA